MKNIRNKIIEKTNRLKSSGAPFPPVHAHMQKLLYFYESRLSNCQLMVLLLVWLKHDFKSVQELKKFPKFYRLKSSQVASKNAVRIIRDGGVSWVEYSIEGASDNYVWMPVPKIFKNLFWRVLQQHNNYEKPILNTIEIADLYHFWMKAIYRTPSNSNVKMAQKTVWSNYISSYCHADPMLSNNAIEFYFSMLHHSSATAYQSESIESARYQIFQSINNAVHRLVQEAEKWEILSRFIRQIDQRDILPNKNEKLPPYLIETRGMISEIQIEYYEHHREITTQSNVKIGTTSGVSRASVINLFSLINNKITSAKNRVLRRGEFINYYNLVSYSLALQFITLSSIRPTHAISPLLSSFYSDRFCIYDKGQARNILLCGFLQEQISRYQNLQKRLLDSTSLFESSPYMIFLINEKNEPVQLTARNLRRFLSEHWVGHVPYQLRKIFSQTLMELHMPNHLISRVMGHSRLGEHDGAVTIFPYEEREILTFLNRLPTIFKMELF